MNEKSDIYYLILRKSPDVMHGVVFWAMPASKRPGVLHEPPALKMTRGIQLCRGAPSELLIYKL